MTYEERNKLVTEIQKKANDVLLKKGADYAGKSDPNANFKEIASLTGMTKYQTWSIYFMKQVLGIVKAIKENPNKPITNGEPLSERIIDVINYASILYTLLEESDG